MDSRLRRDVIVVGASSHQINSTTKTGPEGPVFVSIVVERLAGFAPMQIRLSGRSSLGKPMIKGDLALMHLLGSEPIFHRSPFRTPILFPKEISGLPNLLGNGGVFLHATLKGRKITRQLPS